MDFISQALVSMVVFVAALFPSFGHTSGHTTVTPIFAARETHVLFGGDMMFDRTIRSTVEAKGGDFVFSCLDDTLKSADLVIANLEGPITASSSISLGSFPGDGHNYTFTFPPSTAPLLFAHSVRIVNLGNNHIENFGPLGVSSTTAALRAAHIGYFGDPPAQTVAEIEMRGVRLAFINYNQFAYSSTASTTISQIISARSAGEIPVVYTHWGEEYEPATDLEKSLARRFVDAGAAIVIGSHPHVVQEHEVYRGKYIYYSLGNLIFDQYWDDAVSHGLMLDVTFSSSGVESMQEIPVELEHDRRTCPVS